MTADKSPEGITEETLENLTAEIRTLRNAVDDLREEFSWAVRNLPALRSPPSKFVTDTTSKTNASTDDAPETDDGNEAHQRLTDDLETVFRHLATEQVELILGALDSVRSDILKAVTQPPSKQGKLSFGETAETDRKRRE